MSLKIIIIKKNQSISCSAQIKPPFPAIIALMVVAKITVTNFRFKYLVSADIDLLMSDNRFQLELKG